MFLKYLHPNYEYLKKDVYPSNNMYLPNDDVLKEEGDIIQTFLNVSLPSIHGISPLDEALIDIANPSTKFSPTYKNTLEQGDSAISTC